MDNKKRSFINVTISIGALVAIAFIEIFSTTIGFIWSKCLEGIWKKSISLFRHGAPAHDAQDAAPRDEVAQNGEVAHGSQDDPAR